ncbi:hypothetical protein FOL47_003141 [Perkinsus chesapeaki]|uniref:Uncharacterized protein n=1 Tax=Perkinsus chesapeaki TaxID=330153 RepID=A0A7J6M9G5_PERCH|nr:hypothetical protein FOL47_003141 [Perkinsus chesapeaki]
MPAPAKESSINASVHELPHPKSPRATSDYGQIEVLTMNGVYKGELKGEFYAGYENDIIVKYPNGLQGEVIDVLYNGDLKHKCRSDRQGAILKLRTSLAGWYEGLAINEDPVTNELSIYVLKRSLAVNGEANSFVAKFMRMTTSTATPTSVLVTLELPESDSYAIRSPFIHVLLTTVLIILAAIVSY